MMNTIEKQISVMLNDLGRLFSENIQYENCPHGGEYHAFLRVCDSCEHSISCSWLSENKPHLAKRKPDKQLVQELKNAHEAVLAEIGRSHQTATCTCDYCAWLRACDLLFLDPSMGRRVRR